MRKYVGQPVPNFQRQGPGPEASVGSFVSPESQRTRSSLAAPFSLNNIPLPQQHIYSYRDDPSGVGPGGADPEATPDPGKLGLVGWIKLLLQPKEHRVGLPEGPWMLILPDVPKDGDSV